jgi:ABC-type sugar transport system ATPase subunit
LVAAARASGLGILLITHRTLAEGLVDRTVVLRDGRITGS